jgi:hypothetical protein
MTNLSELTSARLKRIIAIMELIETLQGRIVSIAADEAEIPAHSLSGTPKKRRMSAAVRARIAAGARARVKGAQAKSKAGRKAHRQRSAVNA